MLLFAVAGNKRDGVALVEQPNHVFYKTDSLPQFLCQQFNQIHGILLCFLLLSIIAKKGRPAQVEPPGSLCRSHMETPSGFFAQGRHMPHNQQRHS